MSWWVLKIYHEIMFYQEFILITIKLDVLSWSYVCHEIEAVVKFLPVIKFNFNKIK